MPDALIQAIKARGYSIDRRHGPNGSRFSRARDIVDGHHVQITEATPTALKAVVNQMHKAEIQLAANGEIASVTCTCQDWRTRGKRLNQPCKHILALAMDAGDIPQQAMTPAPAPPLAPAPANFGEQVRRTVGQAITDLAAQVEILLLAGEIPFLIGPTGCGKTSAIRMVATRNGWGFEEVAGCPSFSDSDLVGLRTDHMEVPGVFARAFRRAQAGENVLLFLDEVTRFTARALDLLMRPLQAMPVATAQAMGIAASEPIRLAEAPLWGQAWAPASKVRIALACNPWGAALDPALVRRARPVQVGFAQDVLQLFTGSVQGAIDASWKAVAEGQLPLPLEYQALLNATGPDDQALFGPYLARLAAVDSAAADGFATLLRGIGVQISD